MEEEKNGFYVGLLRVVLTRKIMMLKDTVEEFC